MAKDWSTEWLKIKHACFLGDDIFSYNDNAILKAAEYVSLYNYVMEDDIPFEEYVNCNGGTSAHFSADMKYYATNTVDLYNL